MALTTARALTNIPQVVQLGGKLRLYHANLYRNAPCSGARWPKKGATCLLVASRVEALTDTPQVMQLTGKLRLSHVNPYRNAPRFGARSNGGWLDLPIICLQSGAHRHVRAAASDAVLQ